MFISLMSQYPNLYYFISKPLCSTTRDKEGQGDLKNVLKHARCILRLTYGFQFKNNTI